MRVAQEVRLTGKERITLQRWAQGRRVTVRQQERARMILRAADGSSNKEIAVALGVKALTAGRWRSRFAELRLAGIEKDLPRGGRPRDQREQVESQIIRKTTQQTPKNATHWSTRTLAQELGVTQSMVHRVWKANGLKPHLVRTFKLSRDPRFEEKLIDVVGLYLNPPEKALVISADEKSQIQALDRTQPSLPLIPGRCGTMTHDYKRNGTTTLFAAIDMLHGKVIADCMPRHRHQEWIKFLKQIDAETPADLDLHLIVDNYATHKHPKVMAWLKRHKRFHLHFIPTSSSWLNVIERFFRDLDEKRVHRGVFRSVPELIDAVMNYIDHHNRDPQPFTWRKTAEQIIEKVGRARLALNNAPTE
ncbi:MAG: IS630 family transposase [Planctomycetes bacterium]|nr:IS630 family transposase [Planctomycetota bacterium]